MAINNKNKNKKEIPSYLQNPFTFKNRVKIFFKKLFHPEKFDGTIEQQQRNERRYNKKYKTSSSSKNSVRSSSFQWSGEFDFARFLWVVIPTIILITVAILSACNVILPAFENLEHAMIDALNNAEFMYLTIKLFEWITVLIKDQILLLILLGIPLLVALIVLVVLEIILFILFWILFAIIFLLFVILGNISMIFLPLGLCIFAVVMSVKAFNDGENQIPSASCIILSFISLIVYYIFFFAVY